MSVDDELQRNLNVLRTILSDPSLAHENGDDDGGDFDVVIGGHGDAGDDRSDDVIGGHDPLLDSCNISAVDVSERQFGSNTPECAVLPTVMDTAQGVTSDGFVSVVSCDQLDSPSPAAADVVDVGDPLAADCDPLIEIGDGGGGPTSDIEFFSDGCDRTSQPVTDSELSCNKDFSPAVDSVDCQPQKDTHIDSIGPQTIDSTDSHNLSIGDLKTDSGISGSLGLMESPQGSIDSGTAISSESPDSNGSPHDSSRAIAIDSSELGTDISGVKDPVMNPLTALGHRVESVNENASSVDIMNGQAVTSEVERLRHRSVPLTGVSDVSKQADDAEADAKTPCSAVKRGDRLNARCDVSSIDTVSSVFSRIPTPRETTSPELITLDCDELADESSQPNTDHKHKPPSCRSTTPGSDLPSDTDTVATENDLDLSQRPRARRRAASSALSRIRIADLRDSSTVSGSPVVVQSGGGGGGGDDSDDDDVVVLDSPGLSAKDDEIEQDRERMVEEAQSLRLSVSMLLNNACLNTAVSSEQWHAAFRDRQQARRSHWTRVRQSRGAARPVGPLRLIRQQQRGPAQGPGSCGGGSFSQRRLAINNRAVTVKPTANSPASVSSVKTPIPDTATPDNQLISGYVHAKQCPYSCFVHMLIDNRCVQSSLPAKPKAPGLCWSTVRRRDLEPECLVQEEVGVSRRPVDDSLLCRRCSQQFCDVAQLHHHLVSKHGDLGVGVQFQCALCTDWFHSIPAFRQHVFRQHGPPVFGDYRCSLCMRNWGRVAVVANDWFLHFVTMHVRNKRVAARSAASTLESVEVGGRGGSTCPFCKNWSGSVDALRAHLLTAHRGDAMVTAKVVKSMANGDRLNTKQMSVMLKCLLCSYISCTDSDWCTHVMKHVVGGGGCEVPGEPAVGTGPVVGPKLTPRGNSITVTSPANATAIVASQSIGNSGRRYGSVCPKCNMKFAKVTDFSLHWKQMHLESVTPRPKAGPARRPLKVARTSRSAVPGKKPVSGSLSEHRCYRCGLRCLSESELAQHFVTKHTRLHLTPSAPDVPLATSAAFPPSVQQSFHRPSPVGVGRVASAADSSQCDGEGAVLTDASISLLLDCVLE